MQVDFKRLLQGIVVLVMFLVIAIITDGAVVCS
jgi:hypothetical protein